MANIFNKVFNKEVKINAEILQQAKTELEALYNTFKDKKDIDYIKVLKNKIEHFLDEKHKKIDDSTKEELKHFKKFLEEIEDYIKNFQKDEIVLIDVVKEIEKKYKKQQKEPEENKDDYSIIYKKNSEIEYEKEMIKLQVELMKLQNHIKESGEKLLIIFEGRDAAGKGGTIKRFREYLNPRGAEVVALEKPNEQEKTQWYFQRYTKYLPGAGEIKFFDRSWYNRAGVEPVMGFVTKDNYKKFLKEVPDFEQMIVDSGIILVKFYFSVSKEEQAKRFLERKTNPLKQYKLSPVDQFSQQLWDKYTLAEYNNFTNTHSKHAPWTVIKSDNKKKARINAIKHVLNLFDYKDKINDKELKIDDEILISGEQKAEKLKKEIDIKQDLFE